VLIGGTVGLERTVVPLVGNEGSAISSSTLITSFIISLEGLKALANLISGSLSDHWGRRPALLLGWLFGLPVPFLIVHAESWAWIFAATCCYG